MDPLYKAILNRFGAVNPRFLAQSVEVLEPPLPITVMEEETIEKCIRLMQKSHIGCLLVVDAEGRLAGIFSERDVLMKVSLTDHKVSTEPIKSVMTQKPHAEPLSTSVAFALQLMAQKGFRHVPIVDSERKPVGVISVKDILVFINSELIRQLAESELESTSP